MTYNPLPYKIMILSSFAPLPDQGFKPDFVQVDLNTLDSALEKISPVLYLPVSSDLCSAGALTLKFSKIKDFKPNTIIKNNSYLNSIKNSGNMVHGVNKKKVSEKSVNGEDDKIDAILSMVETSDVVLGKKDTQVESSDMSSLLKEIYSDREFKKIESAWRGLQTLVKQAEIKGFMKIDVRISSVSYNSLENTLKAIESLPIDQMPNLLLIDLFFDNTNPKIDLLEKIADFADKMMLPVALAIGPGFFRMENWDGLGKMPYIKHYLEHASYARWRKMKKHPGAAWLMTTCNGFPVRDPNEFEDQPVFASPVWGLGILCAKSVKKIGWPTAFTQYTSINIGNLPIFSAKGRSPASVEVLFSEDRIMQFIESGISPLVGAKNKDFVFMPRQTALSGSSIKFQMFFNRIIEALINMRHKIAPSIPSCDAIESLISDMFMDTINNSVHDISVESGTDGSDNIFIISFTPPAVLVPGAKKIEFSFSW